MKQLKAETADDEKLGNVTVTHANLVEAERVLEEHGLGETTMSPIAHHLLAGGLAYLLSHPTDPVDPVTLSQIVQTNRGAFASTAKIISLNKWTRHVR